MWTGQNIKVLYAVNICLVPSRLQKMNFKTVKNTFFSGTSLIVLLILRLALTELLNRNQKNSFVLQLN